jgi:serine/threonine protein kinase
VPGRWELTPQGKEIASTNSVLSPVLLAPFDLIVSTRTESIKPRVQRFTRIEGVGDRKAYRLPAKPLATGGQADVYEAKRKSDGRIMILKRIRGRTGRSRMKREIEIQLNLEHSHIMPIVDWDTTDFSWYVMPRGARAMSDIPRPLPVELICLIAKSVALALDCAHTAGHPHRDVKPHNIIELVSEDGTSRWMLADWGLTRRAPGETTAKETKTGHLLGSEGFAPPEAYRDAHNVGPPGDIYALGQVIAWSTGFDPVPFLSPKLGPPWGDAVTLLTQQEASDRPKTITEVLHLIAAICAQTV